MGKIVGAFATSHVIFSSRGVEPQARKVAEGFKEIGRRIAAAKPDLVVVISSEHGPTLLPLGAQPPFAVAIGSEIPTFGELDIPKVTLRGHPEFAGALLRGAAEDGFDLASIEDFKADHGTSIPVLLSMPERDIPIVPLLININAPQVTPTPARCYKLGRTLRRVIESRPDGERVAVLGAGGLSHWLGGPEMGRINSEFDKHALSLLAEGRGGELAKMTSEEVIEKAGNGGQEIRNWLFVAAAVEGLKGEVLYYEPIKQWFTGMGAMAWSVA